MDADGDYTRNVHIMGFEGCHMLRRQCTHRGLQALVSKHASFAFVVLLKVC